MSANIKGAMDPLRIVLLGKTGDGKSSCGNTILDENLFHTANLPNSVTHKCESETKFISGREFTVIDTPGLFDTTLKQEELNSEILTCITECAPGPHAFVLVLTVGRYTKHEKETVENITASFGEEALKYTVVLFTHGDNLSEDQTIEDFVLQSSELQELVKKCGGRVHVLDNKHWKQQQKGYRSNSVQVENLLITIEEMVRENGGDYYSNEMLQTFERAIAAETKRFSKDRYENMQHAREHAKQSLLTKLKVKFVGVATGVLVGALLGAIGAVTSVIVIMKEVLSLAVLGGVTVTPAVSLAAVGAAAFVGVTGGITGGITGYKAVEGTETVTEAMKKAAKETYDAGKRACENIMTITTLKKNPNY